MSPFPGSLSQVLARLSLATLDPWPCLHQSCGWVACALTGQAGLTRPPSQGGAEVPPEMGPDAGQPDPRRARHSPGFLTLIPAGVQAGMATSGITWSHTCDTPPCTSLRAEDRSLGARALQSPSPARERVLAPLAGITMSSVGNNTPAEGTDGPWLLSREERSAPRSQCPRVKPREGVPGQAHGRGPHGTGQGGGRAAVWRRGLGTGRGDDTRASLPSPRPPQESCLLPLPLSLTCSPCFSSSGRAAVPLGRGPGRL